MTIGRISRFVLKHKALVASVWLAIAIASIVTMPAVIDRLSTNFDMPGTESTDASIEILQTYGSRGYAPPLVPVVTLPEGTTVESPGVREELGAVLARIAKARPEARTVSWASTGDDAFVADDGRTTFGLVYLMPEGEGVLGVEDIRDALSGATVAGEPVYLSGRPALSAQVDESRASVLIETLTGGFGALLVLLVLLYIFGSALALLLVRFVTYIFLVRSFRSLLLPLKALVLNVLSVASAYGVLVLVWQFGWGSEAIWGIPSTIDHGLDTGDDVRLPVRALDGLRGVHPPPDARRV